jgi:hypothetical protein
MNLENPRLISVDRIFGKTLTLKKVNEEDSELLVNLRNTEKAKAFLNPTTDDQVQWISDANKLNNHAYFIIYENHQSAVGCIRMYNSLGKSYSWGSWILTENITPIAVIESCLLTYWYADKLGFEIAKVDVRKNNIKVQKFHENIFSAKMVDEDKLNIFYEIKVAHAVKIGQKILKDSWKEIRTN